MKMQNCRLLLPKLLAVALAWCTPVLAGEPSPQAPAKAAVKQKPTAKEKNEDFLRLVRDQKGSITALESAVVTLAPRDRSKKTPTVDLIAAVHIGDKGYYQQLNKLFTTYDAVLYELVAPKGTRLPKGGGKNDHPVAMIQVTLTRVLDLAFQLDLIDYTKDNMVHADMSPDLFAATMEKRGESVWTILARMMAYGMAQQGDSSMSDAKILAALFNPNRAVALKRVMAEQFRNMEGSINAIEGPQGSTLISERNKVALQELRKEIAGGKKKIAIFYGAGHMPDFLRRIKTDFGLVPTQTRWLVAWNMKDSPAPKPKPAAKQAPVTAER